MPVDITSCDCSHHKEHADQHLPHPLTGRLVCQVCHRPPAAPKISRALQRFIDVGGPSET